VKILNNPFGIFLYLFLRNDYSWGILSREEKNLIHGLNRSFNTGREDYANPELYGLGRIEGGENWDSTSSREKTARGRALLAVLKSCQPKKILEVGPGPGFFSRVVCESPSVRSYTAIDLGANFLEYLKPRLEKLGQSKTEFKIQLLQGELAEHKVDGFDFILVLSCVHHIPNRKEFLEGLAKRLVPGGYIFCFDPSHYLVRWTRLLRGLFVERYLSKAYYLKRENLSTHHFCTSGEYRKILRGLPELELEQEFFEVANRVKKLPLLARLFPRFFSVEMGVLLRRKDT
jgi:2-polyprenyl-3-methyl-5-hydroxy-6-metoxy-1,4-benzoquinol methylase